ncbi:transporter substrate-binding domain-containing protein [Campylobacterota bacterium DY0563]
MIFKVFFTIFLFVTSSFAVITNKDVANQIANPFYVLDENEVINILENHMDQNDQIKYITLYDSLTNKRFLFLYKNREHEIIQENFDEVYLQIECKKETFEINYKNELIGRMDVCSQKQKVSIELTDEEKKWLSDHPVIKVHNEYDWAPFNFNKNGFPLGYSIDYINLLSKIAGFEIEFVTGTWDESLNRAYNKEIDIMLNIAKTKDREKKLSYVNVYARNVTAILTKDNRKDITNIESLFGKKVSVIKGFLYEKYLKNKYPKIEIITYNDTLSSIKAVVYGEVDATLGKTAILNNIMHENVIKGLKYTADVKADDPEMENLYIAVRNDAPQLHSILTKAMRKVSIQDIDKLKLKWFDEKRRISFSKKEYTWLDKKVVIKYSEIDWKPLSIIENSSMSGIMGDYLNIVSEATGIEFKFVPSNSWPDVLEKFKNGEIDLVPGIGDSKEEVLLGLISNRYASYPMVIVTNDNIDYVESLDKIKNKVFAIPKYFTSYNYIKALYPNIKIIETRSIFEALLKVSNHEADVFIGHIAPALYNISKIGKDNLKLAGQTGKNFNHHYLINPKMPELLSIVNKVFRTISEKDRERIYNGWVKVKVEENKGFSLQKVLSYVLPIIIIILIIITIIVYWNKKLRQLVDEKTADIKSQKEQLENTLTSLDKNVIFSNTDKKGNITKVSTAFCNISGYTIEELIGQSHNIIRHPDMSQKIFKHLWKNLKNKKIWEGEIKNKKKDGSEYWLFSKIEPDYDKNSKLIGYKAISQDITNKKIVEDLSKNLELKVEERTIDLENAKKEIELIHQQTQDSIEYASLIQHALIPENTSFKNFFSDYFAIWQPKDIVGGDIYLFEELRDEDECILMVIDCTGHGVPGAFVTMLVKAIERQIVSNIKNTDEIVSPAKILSIFNKSMKHLLKQEDETSISNAGFDGGILYYNKKNNIIKYAGAETPLFYEEDGKINVLRGDRQSIGYKKSDKNYQFTEHTIELTKGMQFYISTDGYIDQNGGQKGFPFGKRRFKKLLEENYKLPFADQQEILLYEMMEYQGNFERNDDMALIGFKI